MEHYEAQKQATVVSTIGSTGSKQRNTILHQKKKYFLECGNSYNDVVATIDETDKLHRLRVAYFYLKQLLYC